MSGFTINKTGELQRQRALQKAAKLLGLEEGGPGVFLISTAFVRVKFAELVKANHPDTGTVDPGFDLGAVRKAKDLLLKHLESRNAKD